MGDEEERVKPEKEMWVDNITHFDGKDFGECPKCHRLVTSKDIYCSKCGVKLRWK